MMVIRNPLQGMPYVLSRFTRVMVETRFVELVERLLNNDREAIELIVARYGPALRRAIDRALFEWQLDRGPRREADGEASDIFQTVMLVFLARLERSRQGTGSCAQLHFETPGHLIAYLKVIAGNEIKRASRRGRQIDVGASPTGCAGSPGGETPSRPDVHSLASPMQPTPSQSLIAREMLERDQAILAEIQRNLRPGERAIWDLVRQGQSWPEVARQLGGSAEALRKTFSRAVRRIASEMDSRSEDGEP
jgi:DNA-directed RNA polymerase specialized sigma24 family protein